MPIAPTPRLWGPRLNARTHGIARPPNTTQIINEMADDELKDACLECDLGAPDTDDFNVDAMRQALRVHYGVSLLQCVTSRPLRVVCCTIPA